MSLLDNIIRAMQNPSSMASTLPGILHGMYYQERNTHLPIFTPSKSKSSGGTVPLTVINGPLITLAFTLDTDEAYRTFKIPRHYIREATFHVHWTKNVDTDVEGHTVRWVLDYSVTKGHGPGPYGPANAFDHTVELTDAYEDGGTTDRVLATTDNIDAPGFIAGHYVHARIRALTPAAGTPIAEPNLSSVDVAWVERINEDPTDE